MLGKKYSINWENDEPISFELNGGVIAVQKFMPPAEDSQNELA